MRSKLLVIVVILLQCSSISLGQLVENFNDGEFTHDPAWEGNVNDFKINPAFQLQSNNLKTNNLFYVSTPNYLAVSTQWEFWIRLAFNPSSANYMDAFLTASHSNLSLSNTYGYFVRIGNTDDEVSLYRKDASGLITKIIGGAKGILNHSNNILKLKVIRDASGKWILFRDLSGTGNHYTSEGSVVDTTYKTSVSFGFSIRQSTASFFQRHYFDDIVVKEYLPDTIAPKIVNAIALSPFLVDVLFDKDVDPLSSQDAANYSINSLGMPVSAIIDPSNSSLVHLSFSSGLIQGVMHTLTVDGVKDLFDNQLKNQIIQCSYYIPQIYDVVIDELLPNPNPTVGLPALKYLELKNVSAFPIDISGWKLVEGNSKAILPPYTLLPDSFVIVCANNSLSSFSPLGPSIGVANFPSMNIGGSRILLQSATNQTIHAIEYNPDFYKNELKKSGGWSLEMIDLHSACLGIDNWQASRDPGGGTPGKINSVNGTLKDEAPPRLLRAFVLEPDKIRLVFDKTLDSSNASHISKYQVDQNTSVISVFVDFPFFNLVTLQLNNTIKDGVIYTIKANKIVDCSGNQIADNNQAKFGIAKDARNLDLVINEILFNPLPMGKEFVEIYNRSDRIIDLKHISIANRNAAQEISNIKHLTSENILLFPGAFIVISTDIAAVKSQYITTSPESFLQISSMPSFPNDKGYVVLLNSQGEIIDEVHYSEKWHFPLIHNPKGVSLERLNYGSASDKENFHSASASVGHATPGYKNSQMITNDINNAAISILPAIFSPDNDGIDDYATIAYQFPNPGNMITITVFDASGHAVRYLQKNVICGNTGYFQWDGLGDKGNRLAKGVYIVLVEVFNKEGKKNQFKKTIVLARR